MSVQQYLWKSRSGFSKNLSFELVQTYDRSITTAARAKIGRLLRGPLYPRYLRTKNHIEGRINRLEMRKKGKKEGQGISMADECSTITDKGLAILHQRLKTLKSGMRWMTTARLGVNAGLILFTLLALTIVTNEIRETYEALHPTEPFHRRPDQNWGYTPLLAKLPESIVEFGVWYSKTAEKVVAVFVDFDPSESSVSAQTNALGLSLTYGIPLLLAIAIGYREAKNRAVRRIGSVINYFGKHRRKFSFERP
jgi:hypothetical protein